MSSCPPAPHGCRRPDSRATTAPSSCNHGGTPSVRRSCRSPLKTPKNSAPSPSSSAASSRVMHRHRRVDRPVRRRPGVGPGTQPGRGLVRLGVAVDVGLRVRERQQDHRRVEQPLPLERPASHRRGGDVPERGGLLTLERNDVPSLRLARRRRPVGERDEPLEGAVGQRIGAVRPRDLSRDITTSANSPIGQR